jgi:Tfp pilus assembly protein PilN
MTQINFLPDSYRCKATQRRWFVRKCALGLILASCLAGWYFQQQSQSETLRRNVSGLRAQAQTMRDQQGELSRLRAEKESLLAEVVVHRELTQPATHTQVLAAIGQLLPASVGMTELTMTTRYPTPQKKSTAAAGTQHRRNRSTKNKAGAQGSSRIDVVFRGLAPDDLTVSTLVAALGENPLFTDVQWPYSRPVKSGAVLARTFELKLTVPLDCRYLPTSGAKEVASAD